MMNQAGRETFSGPLCCFKMKGSRSQENVQWAKTELGEEIPVFEDTKRLFEATGLFDACLIVTPYYDGKL